MSVKVCSTLEIIFWHKKNTKMGSVTKRENGSLTKKLVWLWKRENGRIKKENGSLIQRENGS